ncbi:hypothetical protein ACFY1P_20005 [Streptomyces sp. NPDC001407]|uniref:hypothetical protein n=1 Tax=Streptomyces sp. NPDC001407 TaxID=3364573 RepID=UPI00367D327D
MFPHLPKVTDSELLASAAAAAKRLRPAPGEFTILTALQFQLYRELHAASGSAVRPGARATAFAWLSRAIQDVLDHSEELSVLCQAYAHLANAALEDPRVADELLARSSVQHGPGSSFLKRLLRFAAADTLVGNVQNLVADFVDTADEETMRAVLTQVAGMEWALDPYDVHRITPVDATRVVDEPLDEAVRFRTLLNLDAEQGKPSGQCLTMTESTAWDTPDWSRIRSWRRRYVAAHRRSIDWAMTKASGYRKGREPLAPYRHPEGLEAGVVAQLRQEAERTESARLWQIHDSLAQMTLRRVQRRADRATTPFDPRHLPSARGMLFLDTPFLLPTGRRIVGYTWGPWTPGEEEGWMSRGADGELEPSEIPPDGTTWTWVTPLTCDQSLLSLPFSPYSTLLLRPGDVLEPETRLRDPENPDRYRSGSDRLGRHELMTRHVRSLWELLTQHERSSVRVLAMEVHEAKPREQRSDRRRGITDSGQVTNVWVDPDAGERHRAQRRNASASGHSWTVRTWRREHERDQCPNSHEHAAREATGGCPHYEITIPEHVMGPAGAPWSDRMLRGRSRGSGADERA